MTGEKAADSAQRAFERAVSRELDAIARHEAAAAHQDRIAAQLEQHALTDPDDESRDLGVANAANARERADLARERADHARARLAAEGVDPSQPDTASPG